MANYIGNKPLAGEFKHLDSIASQFNGGSVTFSLLFNGVSQSAGDASQLIVSLNGVIQEPLTSYTLGSGGSTITFSSAPANGDTCFIVMLGGVGGTTTPSDNSVTTAKIASGAVTSAKLDTNIAVSGTTNIGSYVGSVVNSPLDIKSDTSHFGLSIEENSGTETWQLGVDVDGDLNFHNSGSATPSVTFDDSGNLLLGKSANGTGTVGVELNPDGTLVGTRSGGNPLFLNRTTSDGKIITLRRDGNEIGYIGSNTTAGQTLLDISSEADANSNIRFLTYGSSSLSERLRIDSTGDINFVSSSSGLINLNFTDSGLNDYARIEGGKSGSGVGDLRFHVYSAGLSEAVRIRSTGDVGIGTGGDFTVDDITGSGYGLVIGTSSASSAGIQIRTGTSGAGNIYFGDNSGNDAGRYDGFIQYSQSTRQFNIGTARETAMVIDSSGNVGIGVVPKTTNATVTGSLNVNRTGIIVRNNEQVYWSSNIYWDASDQMKSLGSGYGVATAFIPSDGSRRFYTTTASAGSADANLTLDEKMRIDSSGHAIIPAGVTLGTSVGVYNAANTLDDYEEGTWTPVVRVGSTSGTAVTLDINNAAFYTKIGNLVFINAQFRRGDATNHGGNLYITGLPFTSKSGTANPAGNMWLDNVSGDVRGIPYVSGGGTSILGIKSGDTDALINVNEFDNGRWIYLTATYQT